MKHRIRICLTLRLLSKWHAGSGEGNLMIDRLVRKNAQNMPYIPGSTLKGVIRENCEKLARSLNFPNPLNPHNSKARKEENHYSFKKPDSPIDRLFGSKFEGGCLFFRDARPDEDPPYLFSKQQARIRRHRMLGTAKEKHLFTSEYIVPMDLKTSIDGYHDNLVFFEKGLPPYGYCLLVVGIMMLERIGGDKSTGGGKVETILDSILYNEKPISKESVFDYLDSEFYRLSKEGQ